MDDSLEFALFLVLCAMVVFHILFSVVDVALDLAEFRDRIRRDFAEVKSDELEERVERQEGSDSE